MPLIPRSPLLPDSKGCSAAISAHPQNRATTGIRRSPALAQKPRVKDCCQHAIKQPRLNLLKDGLWQNQTNQTSLRMRPETLGDWKTHIVSHPHFNSECES